jgi:hypothetical protein
MAILIRRPTLIFKVAARRADTFTGAAQVPRASLVRAVQAAIASRTMGQIKVHHLDFTTIPAVTRCAVKVTVPRKERQRFIAEFGGVFNTITAESHPVQWCFMEF